MDPHQQQINALENQLAEARAMAFRMMTLSSEMGQINQFLSRSFSSESFEVLAQELLDHLASSGLQSSLAINDDNGRLFFTLRHDDNLLDEALIAEHQSAGRLVELGGRLLVNYPTCSLLIENVPSDNEQLGILRDHLALLMGGVDARIRSLILEYKAEESRRVKDEFFSLMSHELRTPLNPIIGYATRLQPRLESLASEKDLKALDSIKENGEHLLRQINDILEFIRMKNGDIKLHPSNADIGQLMLRSAQEVESMLQKNAVTLKVNGPKEDLLFFGDAARLNDIFISLLSNAIKYSPRGMVTFTAKTQDVNGNESLVIEVKDTGIGIDPGYHERIFHHFTDRDTPTSNRKMSLGVSLYVTRELVRLHGGSIQLESAVGEGSLFRAVFPGVGSTPC